MEDWATETRRLHRAEGMPIKAFVRKTGVSRNVDEGQFLSYRRRPATRRLPGRPSHRRQSRRAVGDRGRGYLRRPPGPGCRRGRVPDRGSGPHERPRQPRRREVRPVGRPPHGPIRDGRRRSTAASTASRRGRPRRGPGLDRLTRPHQRRADRRGQRPDRPPAGGPPGHGRTPPPHHRPDHHDRHLAHASTNTSQPRSPAPRPSGWPSA